MENSQPAVEPTRCAVILVAGVGSRLRPLTDDRPKALVEVQGETILHRAVRLLIQYGITRLVLATGYREDAVRAALEGVGAEVVYCPNPRFDSTQNSVSLALCADAVGERSFFKLDGDVIFQPELLPRLDASTAELAVGVDAGRKLDEEAMKVVVRNQRRIETFGKGVSIEESAGESIGIERVSGRLSRKLFGALSTSAEDLYYEDVYAQLINSGSLQAEAVDVSDLPWTEIDTFEDLEQARVLLGA
ncbi:MAG: phosphocholine cytidylyltransferase family protein [Polyangiaceae bacterium]|nr:phosphocholine cytidylyltransferase family protein [Myxococcales bacterium]MCB9586369.1 phosphocholine cytidylyltransferase family protein [Polyangiaceae bacterium]MCB9607045.1 phosphocholine cytidylyltransferase family protein [Polyangiaceae bacterium]